MNRQVKSTCCYCGVGCGVIIETGNGTITGAQGDPDYPANRGRLCTKGATLAQTTSRIGCSTRSGAAPGAAVTSGSTGTRRSTRRPADLPRRFAPTVLTPSPSTFPVS